MTARTARQDVMMDDGQSEQENFPLMAVRIDDQNLAPVTHRPLVKCIQLDGPIDRIRSAFGAKVARFDQGFECPADEINGDLDRTVATPTSNTVGWWPVVGWRSRLHLLFAVEGCCLVENPCGSHTDAPFQ